MMTLTYLIVGLVATMTLGFSILAATMLSRKKRIAFDPVNVQTLMSYTVVDNHGGYMQNDENDEYFEEVPDQYQDHSWTRETGYYSREVAFGYGNQLTAVNHHKIMKPAYQHFR